jgi:hypothetical protein
MGARTLGQLKQKRADRWRGQHACRLVGGCLLQATSFRRRRAKARRPPQAAIRPGNPAPTTGPGTSASTVCRSTLAPVSPGPSIAVTSRNLNNPPVGKLKPPSQTLPGPLPTGAMQVPRDVLTAGRVPLPTVPAVLVPHTCQPSLLVALLAEKLMFRERSPSVERSSWMKLPTVISLSAPFVRPRPLSSPPRVFPNRCAAAPRERDQRPAH